MDALCVESFETADAAVQVRGTVHGQLKTDAYPCRTYAGTCGQQPFDGDGPTLCV
ncbi:MAG TPA: hypothetical protein VFE05_06010 [Longimicrobiaceae bacterium]|nr:hypothetical protein [Longimicrobiaceae bacterium]